MSDSFYADLPTIERIADVMRPEFYTRLPPEWHVVVADVTSSTKAIEWGLYKHVNVLGASCIMAVLNVCDGVDLPFVFGGDGTIMAVPDRLLERTHEALLATKLMAIKRFKLDLRIGSVPVSRIEQAGHVASVARWRVSRHNVQSVFAGAGFDFAETLIKERGEGARVLNLAGDKVPSADFSGLECRWQDIKARHGEIVCLIVKSVSGNPQKSFDIYADLLRELARIYGDDDRVSPLSMGGLRLALSGRSLGAETLVLAAGDRWRDRAIYAVRLKLLVLFGKLMMYFGLKVRGIDWGVYKETLMQNADYRRFIESYRQVLSGRPEQREKLCLYLEERYDRGELVYGVQVSDRALMTCLVFDYIGRHMHFLDGADGGFALAAKDLKRRIKERSSQSQQTPPDTRVP